MPKFSSMRRPASVLAGLAVVLVQTALADPLYPSPSKARADIDELPDALVGGTAVGPVATAAGLPSPWAAKGACGTRPITTVEMACLKINCSWLLVSSTSEYLSKLLMRPESFTPLIR